MLTYYFNTYLTFTLVELTELYGFLILMHLLPSFNTKGKGRVSCQDTDKLLVTYHEVIFLNLYHCALKGQTAMTHYSMEPSNITYQNMNVV